MSKLKWSFKDLTKFLKDHGFVLGHVRGSHYFYNGRIRGEERIVQIIFSDKEKERQSLKTMKMVVKHSGIPKLYFEEWKKSGIIHREIIY
ncbi:MAG: hypothetical protein WC410_01495 [Candidatus Paceibacterota bacterium]|jgi:predicted RNA binding protein YcfA (HicA-like mRNA interferase family)